MMNGLTDLSPPQRMAVAYARPDLRGALGLLLELDNRLMAVAAKGQEPLIKQLRLAWWREQLAKDATDRPKGEPLLAMIPECEHQSGLVAALQSLVDAWDAIIVADGDVDSAMRANRTRVEAVFGSYAKWAGSQIPQQPIREVGEIWAKGSMGIAVSPKQVKILSGLKPLNLLCLAYSLDQNASGAARFRRFLRMNWHALTGL